MKKFYGLLIAALMFLSLSCENNNVTMIGVKDDSAMENGTPIYISLNQNYPNPYYGSTKIEYRIYTPMHVTLKVYTEDWVLAGTPVDKNLNAGYYAFDYYAINSKNELLPAGDYYYTLSGNGTTLVRTMRIIK